MLHPKNKNVFTKSMFDVSLNSKNTLNESFPNHASSIQILGTHHPKTSLFKKTEIIPNRVQIFAPDVLSIFWALHMGLLFFQKKILPNLSSPIDANHSSITNLSY